MIKPIYVGIENEFQLWREGNPLATDEWISGWLQTYASPVHVISPTAIRTKVGSSLYVDVEDPEVVTPPLRVQKGFTRRAADLLYLARKELMQVLKADEDVGVMGYSAHYNLTNPTNRDFNSELMRSLAIPYSLLSLTPLSVGTNMRIKDDNRRLELLGDYVEDFNQVRALLLFYAGTVLGFEDRKRKFTPKPIIRARARSEGNAKYYNYVTEGRNSPLTIRTRGKTVETTAQEYLERCFTLFREVFEYIGDEEEVRNLEDFVRGRKELEVDKVKKYGQRRELLLEDGFLSYHPDHCVKREDYAAERAIPTLHARFMGLLANEDYATREVLAEHPFALFGMIKELKWGSIALGKYRPIPATTCGCANCQKHQPINSVFGMELAAELFGRLAHTEWEEGIQALCALPTVFRKEKLGESPYDDITLLKRESPQIPSDIATLLLDAYLSINSELVRK